MKIQKFHRENFEKISKILKSGKVCVLPTDTIFGFSAAIFAFSEISKIKKRAPKKPFLILFSDFFSAEKCVQFSDLARFFFAHFDGPITFVLPRKKAVFPDFFPDEKFLAIRVPKSEIVQNFLHFFDAPIVSTSINFSGENPISEISEIEKQFPEIPIFKNENNSQKSPSGIIKIDGEKIEILRGEKLFCEKIKNLQSNFLKAKEMHNLLLAKGEFWKR